MGKRIRLHCLWGCIMALTFWKPFWQFLKVKRCNYSFARAAIAEEHRLSESHCRDVFPHGSGGGKSRIRCQWVWVLLSPLSWACRWLRSCCVLTWTFLHVHTFLTALCIHISLSYKDIEIILARTLTVFLPLKDIFQIQLHCEALGVRTSPYEFWGDTVKPMTPYNSHHPSHHRTDSHFYVFIQEKWKHMSTQRHVWEWLQQVYS